MRIVIFGANGFIGVNLINELLKNNTNNIFAYDKEFTNFKNNSNQNLILNSIDFVNCNNFDNFLEEGDIVIHLISSNVPGTNTFDLKNDIKLNSFSTIDLLDSCVRRKVKKIIYFSSGGAIYGENISPCEENSSLDPISSYGLQKLLIEKILKIYEHRFALKYNVIRLSNPYGPYQKPNRGQGVVNTFLFNIFKGNKIKIYGDGNVVRDYIFITDAILMILKIVFSEISGTFNVGSGKGMNLNEIIADIEKLFGLHAKKEFVDVRVNDISFNVLNIEKFIKTFGPVNFLKFEDGLKLTIEYFKEEKIL